MSDDQQWRPYQSDDDSEFLTRGDIKTAAQAAYTNETAKWVLDDYYSGAPHHKPLHGAVVERLMSYGHSHPEEWEALRQEIYAHRRGPALAKAYQTAFGEVENARSAQPQQSAPSERVIRASDFEPPEEVREEARQESVDRYNRAKRSPTKKE